MGGWGVAVPWLVSSYNGYNRVSVGGLHACAPWTVGSYRGVDCWGSNSVGQIGHDPAVYGTSMIFTWGTGTGWDVAGVSTRGNYTCVNQGNTTVQCFGDNLNGQLGNGNQTSTHVPQTVGGAGTLLHSVSAGPTHACALDPNGMARCWGNGDWGKLGNRQGGTQTTPVGVTGQPVAFRAIAAGARHTCAIGNDDQIYCWGDNTYGQLGRGFPTYDGTPLVALPTSSRVE
jgi:alpha-tubulin suppressor-like RCC1 family protein